MADLTTRLRQFLDAVLAGSATLPVGTGTATAKVSGVLTVSTTQAGTGANTDETDLWSYSLPANTLNVNGKGVRVSVSVVYAANANTKTAKLYFGSHVVTLTPTTTAANNISGYHIINVIRTGASAQIRFGIGTIGTAPQAVSMQTPAEDTTAAITIKVTGQNGSAVANDIVFRGAIVEVIN